jgi:hypothetical protein
MGIQAITRMGTVIRLATVIRILITDTIVRDFTLGGAIIGTAVTAFITRGIAIGADPTLNFR